MQLPETRNKQLEKNYYLSQSSRFSGFQSKKKISVSWMINNDYIIRNNNFKI